MPLISLQSNSSKYRQLYSQVQNAGNIDSYFDTDSDLYEKTLDKIKGRDSYSNNKAQG